MNYPDYLSIGNWLFQHLKKDEFESSMTALQRYSMYLELIDEIREDTIKKNKDVYDARKNFYNEVSNIRSKIDVLPDDIKEFYNINVQEIINNFERHLKDISNKKYYSNLYNNELDYESLKFYTTDSIQTLVELSESISSIYNNEGKCENVYFSKEYSILYDFGKNR